MNRRAFLRYLGLTSVYPFISKHGFSSPVVYIPKEWNLAVYYPSHCASPIIFAHLKNWFKDAGIRIRLVNFESIPRLVLTFQREKEKFIAGQIPASMLVMQASKKLVNNEPPLIVLSVLGVHGSALLVRTDSQIMHPRDLKGKRVGSPAPGVIHNLLLRVFLEKYNIKLQRDVQIIELTLDQAVPKFQQREIDAILFPEPITSLAEFTVNTRNVISTQFIWKNHPCCLLSTHQQHVEKERNLLRDINAVIIRSERYINPAIRRDELIATLKQSPFHKPYLTDEIMKRAFRPGRSDFDPYIYKSTMLLLVDLLKYYNMIPKIYDSKILVDSIFNIDLLKESYRALNIPIPQNDYRYEILLGEVRTYS